MRRGDPPRQYGFEYADRVFRELGMRAWDRLHEDGVKFDWHGFSWRWPRLCFVCENNHCRIHLEDAPDIYHGNKIHVVNADGDLVWPNRSWMLNTLVYDYNLESLFKDIEQMGIDV